jgi:hypothetical protein
MSSRSGEAPPLDPVLADLAVRVARAELERDAALEREQKAKNDAHRAWEAYTALAAGDKDAVLRTLHICGLPAQDLADIYDILYTWRQETRGSDQSLLDWWRRAGDARGQPRAS